MNDSGIAVTIDEMRDDERQAVHALLRALALPLDGFDEPHVSALVARQGERVVGSAALEFYGTDALLRSVAVDEAFRGRRLGQLLTAAALAAARQHGVQAVYLLTETAAEFFPRFGFSPVSRGDVPAGVQRSVEFVSACPASAQAMMLRL